MSDYGPSGVYSYEVEGIEASGEFRDTIEAWVVYTPEGETEEMREKLKQVPLIWVSTEDCTHDRVSLHIVIEDQLGEVMLDGTLMLVDFEPNDFLSHTITEISKEATNINDEWDEITREDLDDIGSISVEIDGVWEEDS